MNVLNNIPYLLVLMACNIDVSIPATASVYNLTQGEVISNRPDSDYFANTLKIFCYSGKPKSIIYLWQSISLEIDMDSDNYVYYEGPTPDIVEQQQAQLQYSWSITLFSSKQKSFKLNPFNYSCIGIDSKEVYRVFLNVIRVDYWKVLLLLFGMLLFYSANRLCKNIAFYYLCGVIIGIGASFLILIYFLSKLLPRKPLVYGAVACGWTVGVYIFQLLWENMRTILINYQSYVLWYTFITGVISFIVCYRLGSVIDERTQNIIQWLLQGVGLFCIFYSSQYQEAAMGLAVLVVLIYNFPKKWISRSQTYWRRTFPPKTRLISNAEYYRQGVAETSTALENLRKYCSSPECNQWKTVLRLKDVKRFASFVEGTSHLSDDEILEYETSIQATDLTDDEDMLTDEEHH